MNKILQFAVRYTVSAMASIFLAMFGWIPRYRSALYESAYQLGWRTRPPAPPNDPPLMLPVADLKDILGDSIEVAVKEPDNADGNVSPLELMVISAMVGKHGKTACFEIGTFDGRTALNLAANTPDACRIYTLDLPPADLQKTSLDVARGDEKFILKETSGARFAGRPEAMRITQLWGDSATFDYKPYAGKMDLVFVDGAHSYEYVKKDTETALRLLKPEGGVILWHDYGSPYWKGLTRAINELPMHFPNYRPSVILMEPPWPFG